MQLTARPKNAEAAPVSRSGFEYSVYTWQMSYALSVGKMHKCQVTTSQMGVHND